MKSKRVQFGLFWGLVAVAVTLTSCTTTYITPLAVALPKRLDAAVSQSAVASEKTFILPHNWQYGNWIVKEGAKITFYADGFGTFEATVFSQFGVGPDELHFQSIQYAKDGNALFTFPGTDVGMRMTMRNTFTDYPYKANFAFDQRFFDDIYDVKWFGRLRLKDENVGDAMARRSSYVEHGRPDNFGSRPDVLPPSP
ncbi:MAG: hypothetical protein AAGD22_02960 [Verrucomicrobiota bacterium]